MEVSRLRATYLTGETVYLRAPVKADAEHAAAWLEPTFPIDQATAEERLQKDFAGPDWFATTRLVIAHRADDRIVGGVRVHVRANSWQVTLTFSMAPWEEQADRLRAEALGLLVPWVRDDLEAMNLSLEIGADQTETQAAAEAAGMERTAVLREWFLAPGGRVDAACYQALFTPWTSSDA